MKILDSSPVIAFYSELDNPDLLHKFIKLGYELRIPKGVFGELENGRTSEKFKTSISEGKIKILADLPSEETLQPKEYLSHKTQVKREDIKKIMKMKKEISRKHSQSTLF